MRAITTMGCGVLLVAAVGCGSSSPMTAPATSGAVAEWACLDDPVVPAPRTPMNVTYVVDVIDAVTSDPVANVNAAMCITSDCVPNGVAAVDVSAGTVTAVFSSSPEYVFLRLSADGYVALDYYLSGPVIGTPEGDMLVKGLPIEMMRSSAEPSMDSGAGALVLRMLSCQRLSGSGVLADGGRASVDLAPIGVTALNATTFWNLPENHYYVRGFTQGGREYGGRAVQVIAGRITVGEIRDGLGLWGQ